MPVLLSFLDIKQSGVQYCVICLRTSSERRLKPPNYLKKFMKSINLPFIYNNMNHRVCYMCERQAAMAYNFRVALNLAANAHSLVTDFLTSDRLRTGFLNKYNSLESGFGATHLGPKLNSQIEQALKCEAQLVEMRARTCYSLTEMLIVSTTGGVRPDPLESTDELIEFRSTDKPDTLCTANFADLEPGVSSGVYVIPDMVPGTEPATCESGDFADRIPDVQLESVTIYDDDPDPIPFPLVTEPRSLIVVSNDKTRAPLVDSQSANFLLHPIVMASGMMTVPTLDAKICDGRLVITQDRQVLVETPKIALECKAGLNFIVDPLRVTNVLKTLSHDPQSSNPVPADSRNGVDKTNGCVAKNITSVKNDCINVQSERNNVAVNVTRGVGSDVTVAYGARGDVTKTQSARGDVTKKSARGDVTKKSARGDVTKTQSARGDVTKTQSARGDVTKTQSARGDVTKTQSVKSDATSHIARAAVMNTDCIDWEDKIPMDLISFTDSNENLSKRPRFKPPLGVISRVESLKNKSPDEVIDLC